MSNESIGEKGTKKPHSDQTWLSQTTLSKPSTSLHIAYTEDIKFIVIRYVYTFLIGFFAFKLYFKSFTAKNNVISSNFLVWKLGGKAQFPHSFGRMARYYAETVPFHKISTPGN